MDQQQGAQPTQASAVIASGVTVGASTGGGEASFPDVLLAYVDASACGVVGPLDDELEQAVTAEPAPMPTRTTTLKSFLLGLTDLMGNKYPPVHARTPMGSART